MGRLVEKMLELIELIAPAPTPVKIPVRSKRPWEDKRN